MPALNKVPEPQKASEGTCFSKRFSINFSAAIFMFIGFLNNRPVLFRILLANQNPGYDVFPTCAPSSSSQPASRWSSRTHSRHMRGNLPGNKPQLNTSVPPVLICQIYIQWPLWVVETVKLRIMGQFWRLFLKTFKMAVAARCGRSVMLGRARNPSSHPYNETTVPTGTSLLAFCQSF